MGSRSKFAGVAAATVVLCATASAQLPAIPGAAAPATPAVPGAPALPGGGVPPATTGVGSVGGVGTGLGGTGGAGGAAPQKNLWGYILRTPEQKAQCKAHIAQINQSLVKCRSKFCTSRIGQLTSGLLAPVGAMTGGLLGPLCPPPIGGPGGPNSAAGSGVVNPADLAKDPTTPEGAAARIKAEENPAVIQAKVAALQFLGTVDCRYYPEAAAGLITGLRAEKNECVRLAAAKALANGCCCNPKIVKALLMVVNCSNKDGFPAEASELVRAYAYVALERCMRNCAEAEAEAPPEPPPAAKAAIADSLSPLGPTADAHTHILLASYFPQNGVESPAAILAEARQTLARGITLSPDTVARLNGPRNVADAVLPALPTFTLPKFSPADVVKKLDAVASSSQRGPREKPMSFISTLPKREPEAIPVEAFRPMPMPVSVTAPPKFPSSVPTSTAPKSVTSLWKDASRR